MTKPIRLLLCLVLLGACGDDEDGPPDSADLADPVDAGVDAAVIDAGADAAILDAAILDAAILDAAIDATPPLPLDAAPGACTPANIDLGLDEIGRGFGLPTDIKSPPGDARIFVAAKDGYIFVV